MYSFLLWTIIISIGSIYLANKIWDHFQNTYAPKQTKNLVEIQTYKYKQIVEDLTKQLATKNETTEPPFCDYLTQEEKQWMIKQLQDFIDGGPV